MHLGRAVVITVIVTLLLVTTLAIVGRPERWPAAESPPRQGEGTDAQTIALHSDAALARLVREPQNSWSNLAFVFGGAWLLTSSATRFARGLGLPLVAVGISSFLYHASAARAFRHVDVATMYWLILAAGIFSLGIFDGRYRGWIETKVATLLSATCAIGVVLAMVRNVRIFGLKPLSIEMVTGFGAVIVVAALVMVAFRSRTFGRLFSVATLFALGVACQVGDRSNGMLFAPTSLIQAHAAWHILSAAAFVIAVTTLASAPTSPSSSHASVTS